MTGKERVRAAASHRGSDRTPITFDAEKEVYEALHRHIGTATKEELFDRLHVDTWMILPGNFVYPRGQEAEERKTSIWGYTSRRAYYSGGSYDELDQSPLAGKHDLADIDAHPWPEPDTLDFSHFGREAEEHADRGVIGVFTWGAYFIATFVRGMEDLFLDFALRKEYAHHLISTIADRCFAFLDRMLETAGDGIDIVYMADDYCSQLAPLFSPALFEEFVVPYLTRMVERVHRAGKRFLLHVCGAVRPLLPLIIEAGVDMLEPVQVRAEGMAPEGLKRDFGRDICFYGGVDLQEVLCRATPEGVAEEVRHLIDVLGEEGGYILGPGHTYIQVDAPMENILAMYDAAAEYRPNQI